MCAHAEIDPTQGDAAGAARIHAGPARPGHVPGDFRCVPAGAGPDEAVVEHEATTSKIGEDQIFYCNQRGIDTEDAVALIVNGYCKEVLNQLPMEFAVEAQKLLSISLEGSVG